MNNSGLNDDDVPELFYLASSFSESSSVYYILEDRVIEQRMNNGWAGVEYAEYGGYISVTAYQMDAGVEEVYRLDNEYEIVQTFHGEFGYTGAQTDNPQYFLYDYGPVGYSYYNINVDGTMATATEDQYLEAHETAYSWRSSGEYDIINIYDLEPVAAGTDAMLEYLGSSN